MSHRPLEGVRVADFTWVIAGPSLTKNLALLGAEVIRLESATRAEYRNRAGNFALLNDNKKSCALDMSKPEAREVAKAIISKCDIVVENFGKGVMHRFGLDYEDLREVKPDIIMLSCSGFGRTGPDSDKLAFGTLLQLFSGWSILQGPPDSEDITVGGAWTDPLTAMHGTFAVLAAVLNKKQTGEGQYIDLSMVEATLSGLPEAAMGYSMNNALPVRQGNGDRALAPHGVYPCKGHDGWIAIAVTSEDEWQGLRCAMGTPDWSCQERFSDMFQRKCNEDELNDHLSKWTASMTPTEAMERLQAAGVPAGPSMSVAGLLHDKHLKERGAFVETQGPNGGDHVTIAATWKFEPGFEFEYVRAPLLGEHSREVLTQVVGLDDAEVDRLIEEEISH